MKDQSTSSRDSDPAANATDDAFMREARIGLSVVAILVVIFLYVAVGKFSGWYRETPQMPAPSATEPQVKSTDSGGRNSDRIITKDVASKNIIAHSQIESNVRAIPELPVTDSMQKDLESSIHQPRNPTPSSTFEISPQKSTGWPELTPSRPLKNADAQYRAPDSIRSKDEAKLPAIDENTLRTHRLTDDMSANELGAGGFEQSNPITQVPQPLRSIAQKNRLSDSPHRPMTNSSIANTPTIRRASHVEPAGNERVTSSHNFVKTIQGDSYWSIAQRVYGDGRFFRALFEFNRQRVPSFEDFPPGSQIETPSIEELRRFRSDLCPKEPGESQNTNLGTYVIQAGDTLFDIARKELGQASRFVEIFELNRDKLPVEVGHQTRLPEGQPIRLPRQSKK